jgi:hypothetical protein
MISRALLRLQRLDAPWIAGPCRLLSECDLDALLKPLCRIRLNLDIFKARRRFSALIP